MFWQSAMVGRQREVKHVFMNVLGSPTVLGTVGEATVAWQPTLGWEVLSFGPAGCYIGRTQHEESQFP
jgi:hypothetical protein